MHLPLIMNEKITLTGEDPYWLFTQYQQGANFLLVDCRPYSEYSKGHIEGAINISVPSPLMLRRLMKGNVPIKNFINSEINKEKFDERGRTGKIILYDDGSYVDCVDNNSLIVFLLKKTLQDNSVCLLNGGFRCFEECFPHLCQCGDGEEINTAIFSLANMKLTNEIHSPIKIIDVNNNHLKENTNSKDLLYRQDSSGPIQIKPHLFLGNKVDATVYQLLQDFKITHIINVTHDLPNVFEESGQFEYLQLPVQDNWDSNLIDLFPTAFSFIDKALESEGYVLVHCLGGISRSSTIIIGYLMLKYNYSLNEAYDHVKSKKSNIAPNFNFMGQLQDFERSISESLATLSLSPYGSVSSEDSSESC